MKAEKRFASEYTSREVEAAKRVMIEVAQNLGDYTEACVLVGGWVPELMISNPEQQHTGSIDVDFALDPSKLTGERYASLLDTLKRKGYHHGEKPFQLIKEVKVGGRKILVDVDFLAPKGMKMKKHRPKLVPDFRVLETEGCEVAFHAPAEVSIEGKMPDGRQNRVTIRVASLEDFLVMKGYALKGRDKMRDSYDIYFSVKNHPGGPTRPAAALKPRLKEKHVRIGLEHLAMKFRDEHDYGPETVVRFLNPEKDAKDFVRRDSFQQVRRFLDELAQPQQWEKEG